MSLQLFNSLTRRVEPFAPLDPSRVTMYVCGPTVYNYVHIGNARPYVVFGVLANLLRRRYGAVRYARNITDVDDKINVRAARDYPADAPQQRLAQHAAAGSATDIQKWSPRRSLALIVSASIVLWMAILMAGAEAIKLIA